MYKRGISLFLCFVLILTMALPLCSCKDNDGDEFPVTIGDVTIAEEPLNIVVLSDCMADIVSYLGYDVKMVGRSIECDQQFLSVVPIVGTSESPNVDSIVTNETDLVIAESNLSDSAKTALAENNIPVLTFEKAKSFEELNALYVNIGKALGGNVSGKAEGQSSYDNLVDTISDFESAVSGDIVKTACYLYLDESGKLCTFTKGTIEHELFSHCGAINALDFLETSEVEAEVLKLHTPAYIFYDDEAVLNYLKADSELYDMSAITNGQALQIKKSDFSRQGKTYEEILYTMMGFMFLDKSTPDEATPNDVQTQDETIVGFIS